MKPDGPRGEEKCSYETPKVLATYSKEELEETIRPHGSLISYGGDDAGCGSSGCGCGA